MITYRNRFKDLTIDGLNSGVKLGKTGFNPLYKWPEGTRLTAFGYYKMRVPDENEQYLEKLISSNWHDVGRTNWYDHYNARQRMPTAFEIPAMLYAPAKPYKLKKIRHRNYNKQQAEKIVFVMYKIIAYFC